MPFPGGDEMKLLGLNKLSKEKKKELLLVVFVTVVVLAGLGFGLIRYQYKHLAQLEKKQKEVEEKLSNVDKIVKRSASVQEELDELSAVLSEQEQNMASRDQFYWMDTTLRRFKQPYNVEISQLSQPTLGGMSLLPGFPYKQASIKLSGTARYHELGRFIADFENQFPHVRLLNLEMSPASGTAEKGVLSFSMDVVALVNPNPS
jgi:Tfp pilus assembly protein PilO